MAETGPIFVGGTGRSGTSVMGKLLNSHPRIVLPAHENKLIVEKGGLRDLVAHLDGRFDMKRRHYAIVEFALWARRLRQAGFRDPALNEQVATRMRDAGFNFHQACEAVAREHPGAYLSLHAVGHGFGLDHYDATVNAFLGDLAGHRSDDGIVDTEGLIRPFFVPAARDRPAALAAARAFLERLYGAPMSQAGAARWCDDTPSNWLYLDFLFELHPQARFVHMIRDPRDVVGSYLKQVWAPSDPQVVVGMFKDQFAAYEALVAALPADRVLEVRLEDIAADKPAALRRLAGFLDEEDLFDPAVFSDEQTHAGSYATSLRDEVVVFLEAELHDWMARHGYAAAAPASR